MRWRYLRVVRLPEWNRTPAQWIALCLAGQGSVKLMFCVKRQSKGFSGILVCNRPLGVPAFRYQNNGVAVDAIVAKKVTLIVLPRPIQQGHSAKVRDQRRPRTQ